jgi:hypothetical protein
LRYCNDEEFFNETILFEAKKIYNWSISDNTSSISDNTIFHKNIFDKLATRDSGFKKMYEENENSIDEMKVILI